jgi:hypothetical protein
VAECLQIHHSLSAAVLLHHTWCILMRMALRPMDGDMRRS